MTTVFISAEQMTHSDYKWIDTRFSLADEGEGRRKYDVDHIEGAVYWHLSEQLSNKNSTHGRHPMPTKEALIELFQTSGLQLTDAIAIYDNGGSPFATRAWWMLQYAGFMNAKIVIEGFEQLKELGFPISDQAVTPTPTVVEPNWNESIYASREDIEEIVKDKSSSSVLIDARAAERYRGEVEPLDPIAGHIPTAINFNWEQLKTGTQYDDKFTAKQQLIDLVEDADEITVYCGSGVTASPLYAMLRQLGYDNVRLYVGSYSDWVSVEDAPVETTE